MTCRSFGMSVGPIPWTAIREWANEWGLEGDQREDLFLLIMHMDTEYLKYIKKSEEKNKIANKGRGSPDRAGGAIIGPGRHHRGGRW